MTWVKPLVFIDAQPLLQSMRPGVMARVLNQDLLGLGAGDDGEAAIDGAQAAIAWSGASTWVLRRTLLAAVRNSSTCDDAPEYPFWIGSVVGVR